MRRSWPAEIRVRDDTSVFTLTCPSLRVTVVDPACNLRHRHALTFGALDLLIGAISNLRWEVIMPITFDRVKDYLNAIAANGNLDPANSGHGVFGMLIFRPSRMAPFHPNNVTTPR